LQEELGEARCSKDELLWLRTLERYGSTCKSWVAARSGGEDIPEAPTYYPTEEEFADPGRCVLPTAPSAHPPLDVDPPPEVSRAPPRAARGVLPLPSR